MLDIDPIPAFSDNYIWLLHRAGDPAAFVVDPGDAAPVLAALDKQGLYLAGILVTHHHPDHVGGLDALIEAFAPVVYGPHNPAIKGISERLSAGDRVEVLGREFNVLEVPGHTLDHIAYFSPGPGGSSPGPGGSSPEEPPLLFCGDTLFAGGCGRLFEGNPPMMLNSLQALAALPGDTRVYCAHEYTLSNLAFARAVEPANEALARRIDDAEAARARGEPTVPSRIALERATNPFLRCTEEALVDSLAQQGRLEGDSPEDVFATVRGWKDHF